MTTSIRIISSSKSIYWHSLHNAPRICSTVVDNFLVKRGKKFSFPSLTRIYMCMTMRRLQPTDTTDYSRTFDSISVGENAQVPGILNTLIGTIPAGGQGVLNSDIFTVKPIQNDYAQCYEWLINGLLSQDFSSLKTYAQGYDILLTGIEFPKPVQPSIAMHISEGIFTAKDDMTIPIQFRDILDHTRAELVDETDPVTGIVTRKPVSVKCVNPYQDISDVVGDDDSLGDPVITFVSTSPDSNIKTTAQALSFMQPMFSIVPITTNLSTLTAQLNGKNFIKLDDTSEQETLVRQSVQIVTTSLLRAQAGTPTPIGGVFQQRFPAQLPSAGGSPPDITQQLGNIVPTQHEAPYGQSPATQINRNSFSSGNTRGIQDTGSRRPAPQFFPLKDKGQRGQRNGHVTNAINDKQNMTTLFKQFMFYMNNRSLNSQW